MMGKLIIDGNQVYELDEECMRQKENERKQLKEKNRRGNCSAGIRVHCGQREKK